MRSHLAHLIDRVRPGFNSCSVRHRDTSETSLLQLKGYAIFLPDSRMHTKPQDTKNAFVSLDKINLLLYISIQFVYFEKPLSKYVSLPVMPDKYT